MVSAGACLRGGEGREEREEVLPLYIPAVRMSTLLTQHGPRLVEVAQQVADEQSKAEVGAKGDVKRIGGGKTGVERLPVLTTYAAISEAHRRENGLPMYGT